MTVRSSGRGAKATGGETARIGSWLLIVLAIPRIVRILYPEIWVEDDFYLESAMLVSGGLRPYLDFVHPHLPLLEWLAAGYIKVAGASLFSFQLLNQTAIYATSLLVFALGARVADRPAAVAAAILYSISSVGFRYHLYERECFEAPMILIAALGVLGGDSRGLRQAILIGGASAIACAIKLTAAIPCGVAIAYLAIARRRPMRAIGAAVTTVLLLSALSAFCYWRYGFEFVFETFLFHLLKGRDSAGDIATYPLRILDVLAALAAVGVFAIVRARQRRPGIALVLTIVAAEYAFFGIVSPTAWGHNYLEPLPFIAIIAGIGLIYAMDSVREIVAAPEPGRGAWFRVVGISALILILLVWVTPIENQNWLHGSVYGFGFVPKEEVRRLADALRTASRPDEDVIAPSFICFEANRRELIRYPETYGVYREALAAFRNQGLRAARDHLADADFFHLIADTSHYWTDEIKDAIVRGRVNAVISDSPIQLLPLVFVDPNFLLQNGFRPTMRTAHFTLWQRSAPAGGPR